MKRFLLGLGLAVVVIYVLLTVGFAVGQPLIWRYLFNERPPANVRDLAALLQVTIALIGLGVAGFGALAYQLIKSRLESDLATQAEEIKSAIMKETTAEANYVLVTQMLEHGVTQWRAYQTEWRDAGYPKELEPPVSNMAKGAYMNATRALSVAKQLPENEKNNELLQQARNHAAFHMASLRKHEDEALSLIEMIQDTENELHWSQKETVAWVMFRFEHDIERAEALLNEVWNDKDSSLSDDLRQEIQERYSVIFSLNLGSASRP